MKFCFVCGKETGNLIEGYCEECYNRKFSLIEIPKEINIVFCPKCNSIKQENKWKEIEVNNIIREKIKVLGKDVKIRIERDDIAKVHAKGFLKGSKNPKEEIHEVKLNIIKEVCPNCSRKFGDYYEAVIQLRGNITEDILDSIDDLILTKNKKEFYRIKEVKGGYDLLLGNKSTANNISDFLSKRYKTEVIKSFRLVTKKEGKDIYRNFILVRIISD